MASRVDVKPDAIDDAATVYEPSLVATYLQDLLGQQLTAVIAAVRDAALVGDWASGRRRPRPDQAARLQTAYQVANLLASVEQSDVVRAWFVGMNPELDDQAPALRIAADPTPDLILRAARTFLAHG
jgi:hypothetical protein